MTFFKIVMAVVVATLAIRVFSGAMSAAENTITHALNSNLPGVM